jgi:hypothetical protein
MKMLRTAQQKKDELERKMRKELDLFKTLVMTNGMEYSTLVTQKEEYLQADVDEQVSVLADNLIYNMSLNEPTTDGDLGESDADAMAGYIVDYSLSYNERYVIVRDYYMAIDDPNERLTTYAADEVAKTYLNHYYSTLYNLFYSYAK